MRIPSADLPLDAMGYTGYRISVPRSVTEGWVYELSLLPTEAPSDASPSEKAQFSADAGRRLNMRFLDLVTSWNLDDADGQPLPLMKTLDPDEERDERIRVVKEVPVDIIKAIAEKVTASSRVSERVQGF